VKELKFISYTNGPYQGHHVVSRDMAVALLNMSVVDYF
jgi:hypothetical protein